MSDVDKQLLWAAKRGDEDDVRRCIQQGANVNTQDSLVSIMHFYVLSYIEKIICTVYKLQDSQHKNYILRFLNYIKNCTF